MARNDADSVLGSEKERILTNDLKHRSSAWVADLLDLSESTVKFLAKTGQLPAFKIGRVWRFPEAKLRDHLERRLERHRKEAAA